MSIAASRTSICGCRRCQTFFSHRTSPAPRSKLVTPWAFWRSTTSPPYWRASRQSHPFDWQRITIREVTIMTDAVAYAPHAVADRKTRVRIWMLGMILFLSTVAYADRSILSISGSGIKDSFQLSTVQLGYILSAFSWAYVIGQIPGGLILDYFGTKRVYLITLVLWSLSTFVLGFVGEFVTGAAGAVAVIFTLRFVLGFVEAPSFPAHARLTVKWFPK